MDNPKSQQDQSPYQEPSLTPAASEPFEIKIENLELEVAEGEIIAHGWTPWAATDDDFEQPELYATDYEGRRVQGIRSEHRYDFCLWQHVAAPPALSLTFTMDFRVEPKQEDEMRQRPKAMVVGVGIDPTGGTDPRSDAVQWALRDLKYGQLVKTSVTVETLGERATAFVRSVAFLPGSNTLTTNGSGNLCAVTCVRTLYSRTYILLPPNAPLAMWQHAANVAQQRRWTIGGSADDAGLGTGILSPAPRVIAIDALSWPDGGLTAQWFLNNYSPGVNFISIIEAQLDAVP